MCASRGGIAFCSRVAGAKRAQSRTSAPHRLGPVITGAHVILYSAAADADRNFFRDVFGFESVDAGHDWLIFALPPAEVAFHPGDESSHELYLMCDNLEATMEGLERKGVVFKGSIDELRWGRLAHIELPGGGTLGIYQPNHPSPRPPSQSVPPITKA